MLFAPIDFGRIQDALIWPAGVVDIALTGFAIGIGWAVDRRVLRAHLRHAPPQRRERRRGVGSPRAAVARFARAGLLVLGGLIALQAIGFDLTVLTVFSGAVGVGIGLGLQKLASNYIAGFTILLDRSIRLGDTITVEGRWMGTVTSVTSRYVLVRRLDGVEVIVP